MELIGYIVDLVAAGLLGVFLPLLFAKDAMPLTVTAATGAAVLIAIVLHALPYLPHRVEPVWQQVSVDLDQFSSLPSKKFPADWSDHVQWKDIFWLSKSRGWLSGAVSEGGGHDDVGVGILLFSYGGPTWNLVPNESFKSGGGEFTWGPEYMGGTRRYRWDDVGPINAIQFYHGPALDRGIQVEGWAAAGTGVYRSRDGGQTWLRSTPAPDSHDIRERYAFFSNFAGVEGFAEIYATGWQGIAHWSPAGGWELQMPAYFFYVSAVASVGGSENRSVWAAGLSGHDELGWGDKSHGAIYRLAWPDNRWEKVDLSGVQFQSGQGFYDLLADDHKVLAVGDRGLIVLGTRNQNGAWQFQQRVSPSKEPLTSIAEHNSIIYIVGAKGTIIYSRNSGLDWARSGKVTDAKGHDLDLSDKTLTRIRFFNDEGWILGRGIVLKSIMLPGSPDDRTKKGSSKS